MLSLKGQLSQPSVRICNSAGSNMEVSCCWVLHSPAPSPSTPATGSLIYSHMSQFTEKNSPKKTKQTNKYTSLVIGLSLHDVSGDKHCYLHKNCAERDVAKDGWQEKNFSF